MPGVGIPLNKPRMITEIAEDMNTMNKMLICSINEGQGWWEVGLQMITIESTSEL